MKGPAAGSAGYYCCCLGVNSGRKGGWRGVESGECSE